MGKEPGPASFRLAAVSTPSHVRRTPRRAFARMLGTAVVVTALVVACGTDAVTRSAAPVSLDGSTWKAVVVAGQPTVAGREPTAAFSNGEVNGTTGCNQYGGSYTQSAGTIQFGALRSTLIGCPGAIGVVEQKFNAALAGATLVSVDPAGRLIIDGTGGAITFEVAATPS